MNIFVLCSECCGGKTFTEACSHITNWTSGHGTRIKKLGQPPINEDHMDPGDGNYDRVTYPDNHIEIDNRLTWFLGLLDEAYRDNAFYVNLTRNRDNCATCCVDRWQPGRSSLYWWFRAIHQSLTLSGGHTTPRQNNKKEKHTRRIRFALEYVDAANSLIRMFLKDKTNTMSFPIEDAADLFPVFWERIGAEGDLDAALAVFNRTANSQEDYSDYGVPFALCEQAANS